MDKKQGIFISYRRKTGSMMSRMIYDRIRLEKGYDCFLDVEKLTAGNFRQRIKQDLSKCDIFILILSKEALDRCNDPNDNVRQEIEAAKEMGLTFIPAVSEDFTWPEKMPEGLEYIKDINAISYAQEYSEAFFDRLYTFIENARAENGTAPPDVPSKKPPVTPVKPPVKPEKHNKDTDKNKMLLIALGVSVCAALLFFLIIVIIFAPKPSPAPAKNSSKAETVIESTKEKTPETAPLPAETAEQTAATAEQTAAPQENASGTVAPEDVPHRWGDYVPSGTAIIETVDGTKYTAIANSLVLKTNEIASSRANRLYKGLDNPSEENNGDKDLISFAEMESVKRNGDKLDIVDIDGKTNSLELLEEGEVLFIGEEDTGTAMSVFEKDIKSISFDRGSTPSTEIKYCTVKLKSGYYRTPVAFLWFLVNTNEGGGIPSMYLCQDLSTYSGIPLPVKRIKNLIVTKNGNSSDVLTVTEDNPHPDQTEMTIKLTTGEEANITTGHYFAIYTMAAYGALQEPSYSELREIEIQ